jgi:hypothetical protein
VVALGEGLVEQGHLAEQVEVVARPYMIRLMCLILVLLPSTASLLQLQFADARADGGDALAGQASTGGA